MLTLRYKIDKRTASYENYLARYVSVVLTYTKKTPEEKMKVVHIVIVKFKPEITEEVKNAAVEDVLALKDTIPQITTVSAGKNFTDRGKGYEYGWVVELEKKEDLPAYASHQSHLDFLAKYKPAFEDVLAFDYEF